MFQAISEPMAPTLITGECANARYIDATVTAPNAGDVIAYHHPVSDEAFIFRIIALSGDTVEMRNGALWVNNVAAKVVQQADYELVFEKHPLSQDYPWCANRPQAGEICRTEQYTETLANGKSYNILNTHTGVADNIAPTTVPEGHVYVLGDHRDNAIDSRFPQDGRYPGTGMLPVENIIGVFEGL